MWLQSTHTRREALFVDLLQPDVARALAARPERLIDLIRGAPERRTVVLDEIQRVPELLNVVIEVKNAARVDLHDLRGLHAFGDVYPEAELLLTYRGTVRERRGRVWILPADEFLRSIDPTQGVSNWVGATADRNAPSA